MAGGTRRKRQAGGVVLPECILGGEGNIDRSQEVPGAVTSLRLDNLSEFSNSCGCVGCTFCF